MEIFLKSVVHSTLPVTIVIIFYLLNVNAVENLLDTIVTISQYASNFDKK